MAQIRQLSRVSRPVSLHGLIMSNTRSNKSASRAGRAQSMKSSVELRSYRVSSRSIRSGPSWARIAANAASGGASYREVVWLLLESPSLRESKFRDMSVSQRPANSKSGVRRVSQGISEIYIVVNWLNINQRACDNPFTPLAFHGRLTPALRPARVCSRTS